jgi:hypothetical protein
MYRYDPDDLCYFGEILLEEDAGKSKGEKTNRIFAAIPIHSHSFSFIPIHSHPFPFIHSQPFLAIQIAPNEFIFP